MESSKKRETQFEGEWGKIWWVKEVRNDIESVISESKWQKKRGGKEGCDREGCSQTHKSVLYPLKGKRWRVRQRT